MIGTLFARMPTLALAGALLAAGTAPAAAQEEPRVFTRTGQWQLEAADEECRIARVFTNGDQQIALALERNRAEPVARLVLVSNALDTFRSAEELGYRFLPGGDQRSARYVHSEMADGQHYFNLGNVRIGAEPLPALPPAEPLPAGPPQPALPYDRAAEQAFAGGVTGIEINQGLTRPVRLETGSLRAAIAALQACQDDLLRSWGLDYLAHQTMTRPAMPDGTVQWAPRGTLDFSDQALLDGGRNPFRIMISAAGEPTACTAMWVSLDASKNERICTSIMEHARFIPALDAQGQPMASYMVIEFGIVRRTTTEIR